jgi:phytoene dehydrogenase-like protein
MTSTETHPRTWYTWTNFAWLVVYLAAMAAVVFGLNYARTQALANFDNDDAQQAWDEFRTEMQRQTASEDASVLRRVPGESAPPTLRLLRDHFETTLGIALLLSSALFATLMFMIRGVFGGEKFVPRDGDRSSRA